MTVRSMKRRQLLATLSICQLSGGWDLNGRFFFLPFHFLLKTCLTFTFSPVYQINMFLWDFSLWKQSLRVVLQSWTALFSISKKVFNGEDIFYQSNSYRYKALSQVWKETPICLQSKDKLRVNALKFTRNKIVTPFPKGDRTLLPLHTIRYQDTKPKDVQSSNDCNISVGQIPYHFSVSIPCATDPVLV